MFTRASLLSVPPVLLLAWLAGCCLHASRAEAQSCHESSLRDPTGGVLRVEATTLAASYRNALYEGEYQGGMLGLRLIFPRVMADASLPGYRIVKNGLTERGLGDVHLGLRGVAYRSAGDEGATLELGPMIDATLPSGDPTRGLGMGHVMLMPGAFLRVTAARLTVQLQMAYGRALGDMQGHVHGPAPIVSPMNRSEVEHSLSLRGEVVPWFFLLGRIYGALPVVDDHGAAREMLGLGAELLFGALDVAFEQQLPLAGDPFTSRSLLRVGAQW
jgi:hypothetical protein